MAGRDGITVEVKGLENLRAQLAAVPSRLRGKVLHSVLGAGARLVRDTARRLTPVLKRSTRAGESALRRGVREVGTVRRAINVRVSKEAKRRGDVGLFVNVTPAKGAKYRTTTTRVLGLRVKRTRLVRASQRGANSPKDPFYWRWLEFGFRHKGGAEFLQGAGKTLGAAFQRIQAAFPAAIAKINKPK